MKYHFLYKTTNIVTSKYYIGVHTTSNIDDGYLGSGVVIKRSIAKYGVNNHVRECIQFFDTREECLAAEKEFITESLLSDSMCMNLRQGGRGGFTAAQQRLNNVKSQQKQKQLRETDPDWMQHRTAKQSATCKQQYANNERPVNVRPHVVGEYKHTDVVRDKISNAVRGKRAGKGNSQFGKMWITNGESNLKIQKTDVVPEGWKPGRTMK